MRLLHNSALLLAYFGEEIGATIGLLDRALALNPGFVCGWHISGVVRYWAGELGIAIEHIDKPLRLSPRARVGPLLLIVGAVHFLKQAI